MVAVVALVGIWLKAKAKNQYVSSIAGAQGELLTHLFGIISTWIDPIPAPRNITASEWVMMAEMPGELSKTLFSIISFGY